VSAGAATSYCGEDAAHDGESPSGGDDDPSGIFCFGFFQEDGGDYAVAKQDEHEGAHKLAEPGSVHTVFLSQ
jgi:hypothetical protein